MAFRTMTLVAMLGTVGAVLPAREAGGADKIKWYRSFEKAREQAKKQNKLMMVDFFAVWCGPCKLMDQHTFTDASVAKLARESFISAKVDVDRDRATAAKYRIEGMPTIVFMGPDGQTYDRAVGYLPARVLLTAMKGVLEEEEKVRALEKKIKENPDNVSDTLELASIYAKRERFSDAEKMLAGVERLDGKSGTNIKLDRAARSALEMTYVLLSEGYLNQEEFNKSVSIARKGLPKATEVDSIARLRATLINALISKDQKKEAVTELKNLLAWKDAPGPLKRNAEQVLAGLSSP